MTPNAGARPSAPSSRTGKGSSRASARLPTATTSSHVSPSVRQRALGERLASKPSERLGRAEALGRAADEQDARRGYAIRHGSE